MPWARAAGSFPKPSSSHCSQQRRRPHWPLPVQGPCTTDEQFVRVRTKELVPLPSHGTGGKNGAQTWVMARSEGVQKTIVV